MKAFRVLLNGREIDRVFYLDTDTTTADEVRQSLINHDGYDSRIVVVLERKRK